MHTDTYNFHMGLDHPMHFPKGDKRFLGHFPSEAILPGVFQIQELIERANLTLIKIMPKHRFHRMKRVSFFHPIYPGSTIEIDYKIKVNRQDIDVIIKTFRGEDKVCSLKLSYIEENNVAS